MSRFQTFGGRKLMEIHIKMEKALVLFTRRKLNCKLQTSFIIYLFKMKYLIYQIIYSFENDRVYDKDLKNN